MVLESVRRFLRDHGIARTTILVAVSGGVDSVVLLHALAELSSEFDLELAVAHMNHGWRDDADADEAFVSTIAEHACITFVSERADEEEIASFRQYGREGAAREVRRAFLRRVADRLDTSFIATGHTADDRAETILYNLARGTGLAGLAGIAPISAPFIRPLLGVGRKGALAYANANDLAWREDSTNEDVSIRRNRIRHRVLPELSEINPKAVDAVCRAGDHARSAGESEALLTSMLWPRITVFEEPGEIRLHRMELLALPPSVRPLPLREAFRRVRGDLDGIDREHIAALIRLLEACEGHADLPLPRLHVRIDGDEVSLSRAPFTESAPWESQVELGRTELPDRGFAIELQVSEKRAETTPSDERHIEVADADRVVFPLTIRNRREGDRFTPLGMSFPVKLKDFLISERVPYFSRDDVPLLCDRDRILWVAGVRLSNEVRVDETTTRTLMMSLEVLR